MMTRRWTWRWLGLLLIAVMSACAPSGGGDVIALPTLRPTPLPPELSSMDGANRSAHLFLDAWATFDYEAMYRQISSASQEAVTFERFRDVYAGAHQIMTLESLTYRPNALGPETPTVMVFNYDVTFTTNIVGEFTDSNRDMHLIFDRRVNEWRVAWTVGDVFTDMGNGARLRIYPVIPRRANIYDRNGELLADQNGRVITVQVVRNNVPDFEVCVATLSQVFATPIEEIRAEFTDVSPDWLLDVGDLEPAPYSDNRVRLEADCNAEFRTRYTRRYLNGSLAPHIIGTVGFLTEDEVAAAAARGFDAESIVGRSGIEQSWDETLQGRPGGQLVLESSTGERVRLLAEGATQPAESVWLTIDMNLQQFIVRAIGEMYDNARTSWGPQSAGAAVVVMNIHTGEILAMVSSPTYEANAFTPFPAIGQEVANLMREEIINDVDNPLLNRATQGTYNAGSTFKIIDAVAVTDSGTYPLDQQFNCTTSWQREPNFTRYDWSPIAQGVINLAQALARSCNTYFYEVGFILDGVDPFILPTYARMMGLGRPTGMTDIAESAGTIGDPDWLSERTAGRDIWTVSDAINMSIGQGYVEVTPLQMVRVVAAVANGGNYYQPQLVRQTGLAGDEFSYVMQPVLQDTLDLRPGVLETVREGLCLGTSASYGTSTHVFRDSPIWQIGGVCGKTGTAQSGAPGDGRLPHAWYVAYAPVEEPEIAVVAIVENAGDGSAVAAPLVRRVLEYYYFGDG